jgi:hypothetical protein
LSTLQTRDRSIDWQKDEIRSFNIVNSRSEFITEVIGTREFIERVLQEMRPRHGYLRIEANSSRNTLDS